MEFTGGRNSKDFFLSLTFKQTNVFYIQTFSNSVLSEQLRIMTITLIARLYRNALNKQSTAAETISCLAKFLSFIIIEL